MLVIQQTTKIKELSKQKSDQHPSKGAVIRVKVPAKVKLELQQTSLPLEEGEHAKTEFNSVQYYLNSLDKELKELCFGIGIKGYRLNCEALTINLMNGSIVTRKSIHHHSEGRGESVKSISAHYYKVVNKKKQILFEGVVMPETNWKPSKN